MKKKAIIAIATLLAFGQGAWADETPTPHFSGTINSGQENEQNGSESKPYLISSIEDLNHLAEDVNSGIVTSYEIDEKTHERKNEKTGYADVYFELTTDLDYSTVSLFDSDEDDNADSNFIPIGILRDDDNIPFRGVFNGNGNTIKGITVNQPSGMVIGLFGCITSATIKNLNLSNSKFTGNTRIGGIVGEGSGKDALIENCYVEESVEVTGVEYFGGQTYPSNSIGGIIGYCSTMQVKDCKSKAKVTGNEAVGGIVGFMTGTNLAHSKLTDCYYLGQAGDIVGTKETGLIFGTKDIVDDKVVTELAITLLNNDSEATVNNDTRLSLYDGQKVDVTLSGRTLYKDGNWNTLCLPFDVTVGSGQMADATAMTLLTSGFNDSTGELTLNFNNVAQNSTIAAGTPYLVKWTSDSPVSDPVFSSVTITNTDNTTTTTDKVNFVGSFSPVSLVANDKEKLYLGAGNTLYYPSAAMAVGACRAYFQLKGGITAGDPTTSARDIVLNFGDDDATGIGATLMSSEKVNSEAWHSLDGRKLNSKPTQKGLYIYKGKKMVVK